MVFQKSNPFPKTVFENVAFGPRVTGVKAVLDEIVEKSLIRAALWEEVKDRLKISRAAFRRPAAAAVHRSALATSRSHPDGRACSALDPASTARIEDLIFELA